MLLTYKVLASAFAVFPQITKALAFVAEGGKINPFCEIVVLYRTTPYQEFGRAGAARSRFARDNKELGPQLDEKNIQKLAS
jgi:hypothetical protein